MKIYVKFPTGDDRGFDILFYPDASGEWKITAEGYRPLHTIMDEDAADAIEFALECHIKEIKRDANQQVPSQV